MIFRLISSQLGASESWLWLTYHHVHLWYIFTYINPHVISFSSPILNSGARDNIFYITHYVSLNIRLPSSAAWHQLTTFCRPLPILHIMDSGRRMNCTQRPQSRISPACSTSSAGGSDRRISAHVQQPSLLNIDLHSTVREQVQTSNIISTDKYNPVRGIH